MSYLLDEQVLTIESRPISLHSAVPFVAQTELDKWSGVVLSVGAVTIPAASKLIYSYLYPRGKTYRGKAEQCTAQVTILLPEQFFPDVWMAERIASTFGSNAKEQGAEMLEIKIYIDTTPILTTEYYVVATVTAAAATLIAFPFPWTPFLAVVIPLVLIAAILGLFIWSIREIKSLDWVGKAVVGVSALAVLGIVAGGALLIIAATRKKGVRG